MPSPSAAREPKPSPGALAAAEPIIDTSVGQWLLRGDGSLPTRVLFSSTASEQQQVGQTRVYIPTLDEVRGQGRIDILSHYNGNLPRLTAAMSEKATRASAQAFEDMSRSMEELLLSTTAETCPILSALNAPQRSAVIAEPGRPCLVLAGPGSGKTRVLTHRAAFLVNNFSVHPSRVLAVTFTNKAAGEMKDRIDVLLDREGINESHHNAADTMTVGTFHAICARFLRLHGIAIGIPSNFDIADTSDTRTVMADIVRQVDPTNYSSDTVSGFLRNISMIKNDRGDELRRKLPPRTFARILELRKLFDDKMRSMNKLDFDDLLVETRRMLLDCEDVRYVLQSRFHHILVDEWQDTNTVQYDIVKFLAENHRNLFVVGDADQSIYKFRGADSRNVSRFGTDFGDSETIALVENYRSTACIVKAAQSVIEVNNNRPGKAMITSNGFGTPITITKAESPHDEAYNIMRRVRQLIREGEIAGYSDVAVMYRTNAQSRVLEEACVKVNIPYRLIGGLRFYERQEIKDLLAYLRVLRNPFDDISLKRAINTPPRGIGTKSVEQLEEFAIARGLSMLAALDLIFVDDSAKVVGDVGTFFKKAALKNLGNFHAIVQELRNGLSSTEGYTADETLTLTLSKIDYKAYVEKGLDPSGGADKAAERWSNIEELRSAASRHESLDSFLESVALVSDVKDVEDESGRVVRPQALSMMTLHGGKGLEFAGVFIAGMEEGLVPMIFRDDKTVEALEEERRLAYVGMTRAKKHLFLSWRRRKLLFRAGQKAGFADSKPSRFLEDIPSSLVIEEYTPEYTRGVSQLCTSGKSDTKMPAYSSSGGRSGSKTSFTRTPIKAKSTVVSYGNGGSNMAPAYSAKTQYHIGDTVRDRNLGHGVIVAASSPTNADGGKIGDFAVLFSSGSTAWVFKETLN
jgi:DNA helicase II / ATP-dependent DNA helicase PcrA